MKSSRKNRLPYWPGRFVMLAVAFLTASGFAGLTWMAGCSANDPFNPDSLNNKRPRVSFFVTNPDSNQELSPTSYSTRTFHWSGTDSDGWIIEYYVAIDTSGTLDAVWDTTTSTDTTLTFSPDVEGNADATFMVACLDNRGAYSDTVIQFVPMQNFPPVLEFESDFDPLTNMQREFLDENGNVIESGSAAADTVYWNWGPGNFRFLAYDPDGQATLEPFFTYTMAEDSPDSTYDQDDPRADPETSWVRAPLDGSGTFEIFLKSIQPGAARTLSVSVKDTVGTGPVFKYQWEVRAPKGGILYIPDSSASRTRNFYQDYLDGSYGPGNWDQYTFWKGFPDHTFTLLESLRKFDLVIWTDTGSASNNIRTASVRDGVLEHYLNPSLVPGDDSDPGKLLLISRILTGTRSGLGNPFRENILGINVKGLPEAPLKMPAGPQTLGLQSFLPPMTSVRGGTAEAGIGLALQLFGGEPISEFLYQMEYCEVEDVDRLGNVTLVSCYCTRCLTLSETEPFDPFVGVRSPLRSEAPLADIVGISLQLDDFDPAEVYPALDAITEFELGVTGQ